MKHDDVVGKLSEHRDGMLTAPERDAVSRHLIDCADCRALLKDWESMSKTFFRRPPTPSPVQTEAFVARVISRLPEPAPEAFAWLTGRWLAPGMGLSFAFLALSFMSYAQGEAVDPMSILLLSGADRGTPSAAEARSAPSAVDVLGFDVEDR